jgi:hypothetical protein
VKREGLFSTPKRNSSTNPPVPQDHINYQQHAERTNSGRKLWPPFHIAPPREARPHPDAGGHTPDKGASDTIPKDPRAPRATSLHTGTQEQPSALQHPASSVVPPRPHSTPPEAPLVAQVVRPRSPKAANVPGAAFGSPFKERAIAVEDMNDQVSMSCNVNMASPSGDAEVQAPWRAARAHMRQADECKRTNQQQPVKSGRAPAAKGPTAEAPATAVRADEQAHKREVADIEQKQGYVAHATPPSAPPVPRVSDAGSSPVDSIWVRLHFHGPSLSYLAPQGGTVHDRGFVNHPDLFVS